MRRPRQADFPPVRPAPSRIQWRKLGEWIGRYAPSPPLAVSVNLLTAVMMRGLGFADWFVICCAYTASSSTAYHAHKNVTYRATGSWWKYVKTLGLGACNCYAAVQIVPYFQAHQGLGFYWAYLGAKTVVGVGNLIIYTFDIFGDKKKKKAEDEKVAASSRLAREAH